MHSYRIWASEERCKGRLHVVSIKRLLCRASEPCDVLYVHNTAEHGIPHTDYRQVSTCAMEFVFPATLLCGRFLKNASDQACR